MMTSQELSAQIESLRTQEGQHRQQAHEHLILAERSNGARLAYEHLLKGITDAEKVREFPAAVSDATGSA